MPIAVCNSVALTIKLHFIPETLATAFFLCDDFLAFLYAPCRHLNGNQNRPLRKQASSYGKKGAMEFVFGFVFAFVFCFLVAYFFLPALRLSF